MVYEVGDVIQTSDWHPDFDGLYVILAVNDSYVCKQIFCRKPVVCNRRSFSIGTNTKIGHIDDISNFAIEL